MITHRAIARRFKAGESLYQIAMSLWDRYSGKTPPRFPVFPWAEHYVEHAIREVLKRQKWQG